MYWQSAPVTKDGTLIEWGTGDHGPTSDNGVREFDPATGVQTYVYANNSGTIDQSQYDNLHYFYIPRIDSLVIPSRGQFHRGTGRWLIGNLQNNGRSVVGTGSSDLFRTIGNVNRDSYYASYNAHQAWSAQLDCGVLISGGYGGDMTARQRMWIIVPSSGFGTYEQPYAIYERVMPTTAGGAAAHKINGRDGCCFAGEYVYWVGGNESNTTTTTPHFFRMRITPHLTSTSATLMIERLPDAPAAFNMALLRFDPYSNALLCITSEGIFAFDVVTWSWAVVTPQGYRDDYAGAPANGLLPRGCMGDFVEARSGQAMRKIIWRPGMNHAWDYDTGGTSQERMYRRYRSIKLVRRS